MSPIINIIIIILITIIIIFSKQSDIRNTALTTWVPSGKEKKNAGDDNPI